MSNRTNYRRGERRRTETGPRWENQNPGAGCNSTHVARARQAWHRLQARASRRVERQALSVELDQLANDAPIIADPNPGTDPPERGG